MSHMNGEIKSNETKNNETKSNKTKKDYAQFVEAFANNALLASKNRVDFIQKLEKKEKGYEFVVAEMSSDEVWAIMDEMDAYTRQIHVDLGNAIENALNKDMFAEKIKSFSAQIDKVSKDDKDTLQFLLEQYKLLFADRIQPTKNKLDSLFMTEFSAENIERIPFPYEVQSVRQSNAIKVTILYAVTGWFTKQ